MVPRGAAAPTTKRAGHPEPWVPVRFRSGVACQGLCQAPLGVTWLRGESSGARHDRAGARTRQRVWHRLDAERLRAAASVPDTTVDHAQRPVVRNLVNVDRRDHEARSHGRRSSERHAVATKVCSVGESEVSVTAGTTGSSIPRPGSCPEFSAGWSARELGCPRGPQTRRSRR